MCAAAAAAAADFPRRALCLLVRPPSLCAPFQVNTEIVATQRVITKAGEAQLKGLISAHHERTGSAKAKAILDSWDTSLPKFWQLVPPAEKNTAEVNPAVQLPAPAKVAVTA